MTYTPIPIHYTGAVAEVKDYFEKLLSPYKHNTYNRRGADLQKIMQRAAKKINYTRCLALGQ